MFGVLGRVGIAAAEQIVADAVDAPAELRRHGHCVSSPPRKFDAAAATRKRLIAACAGPNTAALNPAIRRLRGSSPPKTRRASIVAARAPRKDARRNPRRRRRPSSWRRLPHAASDQSGPARLLRIEVLTAPPRLEAHADLRRRAPRAPANARCGHSASSVSHSRLAGSIWSSTSRVSSIRGSGGPALGGRSTSRTGPPPEISPSSSPWIVAHAHEVEDGESPLADVRRLARAPAAHLLIQDRAAGEPRHDQIHDFRAIEARIQHVDADEDLSG